MRLASEIGKKESVPGFGSSGIWNMFVSFSYSLFKCSGSSASVAIDLARRGARHCWKELAERRADCKSATYHKRILGPGTECAKDT